MLVMDKRETNGLIIKMILSGECYVVTEWHSQELALKLMLKLFFFCYLRNCKINK